MASKPISNGLLTGQSLRDAALPLASAPQGGREQGFDGVTGPAQRKKKPALEALNDPRIDPRLPSGEAPSGAVPSLQQPASPGPRGVAQGPAAPNADQPPEQEQNEFAGMGPWLEDPDEKVFQKAHDLVLRQEILAQNRLALDTHFTRVKQGCWYSVLEKDEGKSTYRATLPAGMSGSAIAAVPNKAWDLCNKATETVLVDFAVPEVTPSDDSDEAAGVAKMAQRFLEEQAGEQGTNDQRMFYRAMDRALPCASSYIERWVDPVGGGAVPLQILAHPQAQDPSNPMVGPDGMPTANPVLRYVTAPEGGQFTDDPSKAAPQWQPKIRSSLWGREHIRCYPEDVSVDDAEKVILLGYMTLGEMKKRFPAVAEMSRDEQIALLDWTPPRFLVLLPPWQQARWKTTMGADAAKQGASDERIAFYYRVYCKATPENPRGADVVVTGALQGRVLFRDTMSVLVKAESKDGVASQVQDVKLADVPITQVTPRDDPDGRDPSGISYLWLFAGATEFDAALATAFLEMVQLWVHPDSYIPSTSPVQAYQVAESRATGEPVPILRPEDRPLYGNQPQLPNAFFNAFDMNNAAIESIASLNKPVTGSDQQQEVSGKARQIAVQQAMVGLSRMQFPLNNARARDARIVLELAMRHFKVPSMVRYVGEDGAYKAEEFMGADFARIGGVKVKAGTGTMLAPEAKVNYLGSLRANGLLDPDEAMEAARPAFASRLGLADDPHRQYVERAVTAWLKGPPDGWEPAWAQHQQALAAWEQQSQAFQQQQLQMEQQQAMAAEQGQMQQQQQMVDQQKQAEQAAAHQAEQQKQAMALEMEQRKHQMALEMKDKEAQIAAMAPQPQAPPEIIVPPPDMTAVGEALREVAQVLAVLAQKEPAPVVMHHEAAPHQPPVINVHPSAAPAVHVGAPVVHVQPAAAPNVHIAAPERVEKSDAPKKPKKRKGTITGPGGKTFEVKLSDDDED